MLAVRVNGLRLRNIRRRPHGILVFVDRFNKMVHLVDVPESIKAERCARVFTDTAFFDFTVYPVN